MVGPADECPVLRLRVTAGGGRSGAGAKTDRHPVRSGQQVDGRNRNETPSPGEAPAPDVRAIESLICVQAFAKFEHVCPDRWFWERRVAITDLLSRESEARLSRLTSLTVNTSFGVRAP